MTALGQPSVQEKFPDVAEEKVLLHADCDWNLYASLGFWMHCEEFDLTLVNIVLVKSFSNHAS